MSEYARLCTACGAQISCNMYGMGRCQVCGFNDNPIKDDNARRAADWRTKKHISYVAPQPKGFTREKGFLEAARSVRASADDYERRHSFLDDEEITRLSERRAVADYLENLANH